MMIRNSRNQECFIPALGLYQPPAKQEHWGQELYQETCLLFGLATFLFIFNLFAEAIHLMLYSFLGWSELEHYLNNFIQVLTSKLASKEHLAQDDVAYHLFINCLRITRQDTKNVHGTVVIVFRLKIDTNKFIVCVPTNKVICACHATSSALTQFSLILKEAQSLTGFLSFCAQAVRLR